LQARQAAGEFTITDEMKLDWFHELNPWVIALVLVLGMLLAAELGFRVGRRRQARTGEEGRGHFGAVQASLLGLLALLLGFTFNMSNVRYDARRHLVVDDANAIMALSFRGRLLPEPRRREFARLLRQYVEIRADAAALRRGITPEDLGQRIARAEALHRQMWDLVQAEVQGEHPAKGTDAMIGLLSDAFSIQQKRIQAYRSRVPATIIGLLFGAAIMSASAVGYSGGLRQYRGVLAATLLSLLAGATLYAILDLDQPRYGIIQVEQTPLFRVKDFLDREHATTQ
jgi:hypothetical protein